MYDNPTYIHTHFEKFDPGKPFSVSKYATKIGSPTSTGVEARPQSYLHKAKNWSSRQIIYVGMRKKYSIIHPSA